MEQKWIALNKSWHTAAKAEYKLSHKLLPYSASQLERPVTPRLASQLPGMGLQKWAEVAGGGSRLDLLSFCTKEKIQCTDTAVFCCGCVTAWGSTLLSFLNKMMLQNGRPISKGPTVIWNLCTYSYRFSSFLWGIDLKFINISHQNVFIQSCDN